MVTTKKVDVAVLGINGMGCTHVAAAKESQWVSRIVGYEPTEELAKKHGEARGIPATSNLETILNDPDIKLIYIAAPNEFHCDLTVQSLRAGKAVLTEKPMGTTLAEARKMLQAANDTDCFLQVGFELRYSKLYTMVKDWIEQGLIGKPLNTHCDYYSSEFHTKLGWRCKSETTLIAEKLCHYLDLPCWWINDTVTDVYSVAAPNVVDYFNHSDNHQITYRFSNGAVSTLAFFMHTAETFRGDPLQNVMEQQSDDGHRLSYLIYGTKGAIETDIFRRRIRRWEFKDTPEKLKSTLVQTVTYSTEETQEWMHNTHGQNIEISRLVAEGLSPGTSAADSLETMKLVFAAETSERENKVIQMSDL